MKKIELFLASKGLTLSLVEKGCRKFHSGGRSFDNDGTYLVDNYKIVGAGKFSVRTFEIEHKVTGRPEYRLLIDGDFQGATSCQWYFIERFLKKL